MEKQWLVVYITILNDLLQALNLFHSKKALTSLGLFFQRTAEVYCGFF